MTVPLIGMTTYGRDEKDRFHLYANYVEAVRRAGGVPLLIPPGETRLDRVLEMIDAVVLVGGGDIDPKLYRGKHVDTVYDVHPDRDMTEQILVKHVVASKMPGLFICRGMQMLNVTLGGTLIEHIRDEVGDSVAHRKEPRGSILHSVEIQKGSHLAEVAGAGEVNPFSSHHQAIRKLAPGLEAVAWAPDGVIEAVELVDHPQLIAVQWHPERSTPHDPTQVRIFEAVVRWAEERRCSHEAREVSASG